MRRNLRSAYGRRLIDGLPADLRTAAHRKGAGREKCVFEEAEQERARREAVRRDFQARQEAERQRVDRLSVEVVRWQESQRLRSYALALLRRDAHRDDAIEPIDKVAQWAAWISGRADQLDPLVPSESSILDLSFEE